MDIFNIVVCSKQVSATFGFVRHYFLQIPHLELEIHPGQYKYGTHHILGFTRNFDKMWTLNVCQFCIDQILCESMKLFSVWYYPCINCETLTRGLTSGIPISFQTLIYAGLLFSCMAILKNFNFAFVAICLIVVIFLFNNYFQIQDEQECLHIKNFST